MPFNVLCILLYNVSNYSICYTIYVILVHNIGALLNVNKNVDFLMRKINMFRLIISIFVTLLSVCIFMLNVLNIFESMTLRCCWFPGKFKSTYLFM